LNLICVAVAGVSGKTGSAVTRELMKREGVKVVGGVSRRWEGADLGRKLGQAPTGAPVLAHVERLLKEFTPDVLVDFTTPAAAEAHVRAAIEARVHPLVGTTGIPAAIVHELDAMAHSSGVATAFIPNFSLGIMLIDEFARRCSEFFDSVEVVETHHPTKLDAPSGTALSLAKSIRDAYPGDVTTVPVHSIRLPGYVAKHDIVFGAPGERVVLSHETIDRAAFASGLYLALRRIVEFDGVAHNLRELLG